MSSNSTKRVRSKSKHSHFIFLAFLLFLLFFCCFFTIETQARKQDNRRRDHMAATTPFTILVTTSPPIRYYRSGNKREFEDNFRAFPIFSSGTSSQPSHSNTRSKNYGSAYKSFGSGSMLPDSEAGFCTRRREMKLMCYCSPDDQVSPVQRAECWVFADALKKNDNAWNRFNYQSSLRELKFVIQNGARLEYVPSTIFQPLLNLTVFSIEFAQIEVVQSDTFAALACIEQIHLPNNQIEIIERDAFSNQMRLRELNLGHNQIYQIHEMAFRNLPQCERMFLGFNNISELVPNVFIETPRLVFLDVSHNHIIILKTDMFKGLGNLNVLQASFNRINFITDAVFIELWSLAELDLDNNQIERISERGLDGLNNLRVLKIRNNKLKVLDFGVLRGTPALHVLKIENNGLESLSATTFQPIMDNLVNGTSELTVTNNNFVCDCRLQWLYELKNQTRYQPLTESLDAFTCVLYNPVSTMFKQPIPFEILQMIKYNNRKQYTNPRLQAQKIEPLTNLKSMDKDESSVEIKKRSILEKSLNNDAFNSASYQDISYADDLQDPLMLTKLYSSNDNLLREQPKNIPIVDNTLPQVDETMHPRNQSGIKIKLFALKPDQLPCPSTQTDPTELPLSRDLMDSRNLSTSSSHNSARTCLHDVAIFKLVFLTYFGAYLFENLI